MERKHVSLVGPTVLIGLGIILLLNNVGYLDWTVWDVLQLWPVLLIAAGLELLLGRRSVWGSLVAALLVLVLIVGGVFLVEQVGAPGTRGEVVEVAHPAGNATNFALDVDPAVVDLKIGPLSDSGNLVEGTVELWSTEELNQRFTEGERARLVLDSDTDGGFNYVALGQVTEWDLRLSPAVDIQLNADFGIGTADLRMTDLAVDNATVDFGIGQVEMALSEAASGNVLIDGGIGTITVVVPRGLGVRVVTDAGLTTRSIPSDYSRSGDTYTSPDWSRADYRTTVTLSLGIGMISVVESTGD